MTTSRILFTNTYLRHILFWLCIVIYEIVNEGWKSADVFTFKPEPELFSIILIAILLTYFNLYVLIPRYYVTKRFFTYTVLFILLLLTGGFVQRYFSYTFWIPLGKLIDPLDYEEDITYYWSTVRILRNSFLFLPIVTIAMLMRIMRLDHAKEIKLREMENENRSAEMRLLKAQINPHFFFNTLNSLYALTLKASEKSSEVVLRLSDLMHYMLYEASANTVLLTDEIRHLESYIYIEKMRFADRMELSFQYSGEIEGRFIPPLILLPFIENAFKHGIHNQAGWITININVTDKELFLKVENSYPEKKVAGIYGLGLVNVKRRLDLIYGNAYRLGFNQIEGVFEVDLKINL